MLFQTRIFFRKLPRSFIQSAKYSINIDGKPLGNIFFDLKVQHCIEKLININVKKTFSPKMVPVTTPPFYKFMTSKELEDMLESYEKKAHRQAQAPPIIDVAEDTIEVLSNDFALDGHDVHHAKLVFTDISHGLKDYERNIVIREPNGQLRTANKIERHRMNQIYFSEKGRVIETPRMFEMEHLANILQREDYKFILDRACIQFEPDDQRFHDVLICTFDAINKKMSFEKLYGTRHFGSLAFYLAVKRKINNMLRHFLESGKLIDASYLVRLFNAVHPASVSETVKETEEYTINDARNIVNQYISDPRNNATDMKATLSECFSSLKDSVESGILRAHGI